MNMVQLSSSLNKKGSSSDKSAIDQSFSDLADDKDEDQNLQV